MPDSTISESATRLNATIRVHIQGLSGANGLEGTEAEGAALAMRDEERRGRGAQGAPRALAEAASGPLLRVLDD